VFSQAWIASGRLEMQNVRIAHCLVVVVVVGGGLLKNGKLGEKKIRG
jgi:hypothetical protein